MRYEELIEKSHQKIDEKLEEIKNSDDDDPSTLASLYDDLAETADKVASRFQKVNSAFNGEDEEEEQEVEQSPQQQKKSGSRKEKVEA